MDYNAFVESLKEANPPADVSVYLKALWHYRKGNWGKAHQIVQNLNDDHANLIHAFLHRDEGDLWNADYWYRRVNRSRPGTTLDEEWSTITRELLDTY